MENLIYFTILLKCFYYQFNNEFTFYFEYDSQGIPNILNDHINVTSLVISFLDYKVTYKNCI